MTRYLVDTNHLSHAIHKVSRLRDRINRCRATGDRFGTCIPALCELEIGIRHTGAVEANHRRLERLLKTVAVWPLESDLPPVYAEYYERSKARGRVMASIDLLLAALATLLEAVLLTADNDFTALPEVATQNWLVP